jgi:hypothetical protein
MFENFRSARHRPVDAITDGTFFRRHFLCERPTRRFSCATGRVFLWLRHSTAESPSPGTTSCVTTVRTVALWPVFEKFSFGYRSCAEKPGYYKSTPTQLINRFFCRLWRSSHVWTRSRGHNHSNARSSKVPSVVFVKNIIFIFIRFVLLYYYKVFGTNVILFLFLDLSYLLLLFLLILLWRFWPVYSGICYSFINYPS